MRHPVWIIHGLISPHVSRILTRQQNSCTFMNTAARSFAVQRDLSKHSCWLSQRMLNSRQTHNVWRLRPLTRLYIFTPGGRFTCIFYIHLFIPHTTYRTHFIHGSLWQPLNLISTRLPFTLVHYAVGIQFRSSPVERSR